LYQLAARAIEKERGNGAAIEFIEKKLQLFRYLVSTPMIFLLKHLAAFYVEAGQPEQAQKCLRTILDAESVLKEDDEGKEQELRSYASRTIATLSAPAREVERSPKTKVHKKALSIIICGVVGLLLLRWILGSPQHPQVQSGSQQIAAVHRDVIGDGNVPRGIESALDSAFPGWRPVQTSEEDLRICKQPNASFKYWLVSGDFDGDGRQDYAAEITQGNVNLLVALFARNKVYHPVVVERFGEGRFGWSVLGVAGKGETIPDLSEGADHNLVSHPRTIGWDTILGIACEKSAVAYIYDGSGFKRIFISD
jgi:hypothetical protein